MDAVCIESPSVALHMIIPVSEADSGVAACFSVNVMIITSGFPTVGEIYTLKCSVTGSIDQPTITWLDDSGVITSSDTTMNPSGSYSSNLTFTPLSASDTGMIMCRATLGDSMQTASIAVTVEGECNVRLHEKEPFLSSF